MRLFKASQSALSEEDRARDLRLTSIASRYRVRPVTPSDSGLETPPQPQADAGEGAAE